MQRQASSWRVIVGATLVLVGSLWAALAGGHLSKSWPVRDALARVELSREEVACGHRMGGSENQQRCKDLAQVMSRADTATEYFNDGLVVLAPALLLFGVAAWLIRGRPERHAPHRVHPRLHDLRRPSAA